MNLINLIDNLEASIPDPFTGLQEDLFLFVSRITPIINVDLLIKNESDHTLLTWRDGGYYPPGWHVPSSAEWDILLTTTEGPGLAGGTLQDMFLVNGFRSGQHGIYYMNRIWAFTAGITAGSMYLTALLVIQLVVPRLEPAKVK